MKFIYPAVFRKTETGTYYGFFPDSWKTATLRATLWTKPLTEPTKQRLTGSSLELSEEDCDLPSVTDPEDMELLEGDIVRNISVNIRFYEGWDE